MKAALYTIKNGHYNCWFETPSYRIIYDSASGSVILDGGRECNDPDFESGVEATDKPHYYKIVKNSNLHKKFDEIFYNKIASIWFFNNAVVGDYLGSDDWDIVLLDYHFFTIKSGDKVLRFARNCDLPLDPKLIYQLQKAFKKIIK